MIFNFHEIVQSRRNIFHVIKEFSFVHMLFFPAAQVLQLFPTRYWKLGFEFATAFKITLQLVLQRFGGKIYHIFMTWSNLEQIRAFSKFPVSFD